jgi:hypothetical protein
VKKPWDDDPTVLAFKTLLHQLNLEVARHGNKARTYFSIEKELRWAGWKFVHAKYRNEVGRIWDYSDGWPEGWATVRSVR